MFFRTILLTLSISLLFLQITAGYASAKKRTITRLTSNISNNNINIPEFPKCPNPGGTLVVSYEEGLHWIVGNPVLQWGSDSVHSIGNGNFVQCYCSKEKEGVPSLGVGQGMQTNWLKVSNLTAEQKNLLLTQGWVIVQNGADFGLSGEPYLAKNINYSCGGQGSNCNINVTQNNTVSITSSINSSAKTGSNNVNRNASSVTINTGNASSNVNVSIQGNFNVVESPN